MTTNTGFEDRIRSEMVLILSSRNRSRSTGIFELLAANPDNSITQVSPPFIHRYKGHAVRKNVAAVFASEALADSAPDAWDTLFQMGRSVRLSGENDLIPYWIFPGEAKIERHVPALPFSRDLDRLSALRRSLAIYRMVFGQSRQEDLVRYLLAQIPAEEQGKIVRELTVDLTPTTPRKAASAS